MVTHRGCIHFFLMLGSLTAILNTFHFLLSMLKADRKWYYIIYISVTIIHLAMNWNNYTRFNLIDLRAIFTRDLVAVVTKVNLAWLIFMFVFDTLPPLYIVGNLLISFKCSNSEKLKALWDADKWFVIVFALQFLDLILFITQDQLRSNSELLGHDRVWLSFISVEVFSLAVHGVLNGLLVERMVAIVKGRQLFSKLTQSQNGDGSKFGTQHSQVKSEASKSGTNI
jgi:hypothetical protein